MLQALADAERLAIVLSLLEKPGNQADLRSALHMTSGTASKQLGLLEARRIIARDRSHGPYVVVCPQQTIVLLQAAADLAAAISCEQAFVDERYATNLREKLSKKGEV